MGKKRSSERSEEDLLRKLRKIEEKLAKRRRIMPSSEDEFIYNIEELPQQQLHEPQDACSRSQSPLMAVSQEEPRGPASDPPTRAPSIHTGPPAPAISPPPILNDEAGTSAASAEKELELDEEVLQLLGDAPAADSPLGPPVHKDIASRWQEILAKGLSKEVKEALFKNYLIPKNCDLLLAPILNPEAKAALPETLVKRDTALMQKQKQLGIALSALASVIELVISNETEKSKILKPLSDACRLLCDSYHLDTKTRRNFVVSSINSSLKDTLTEAERDKFLFGENVSEKLKTAKNIQKSGEALKNHPKPMFTKNNNFNARKGNLNYKPTHRKTEHKLGAPKAARPAQRGPAPPLASRTFGASSNAVNRPRERSPPRKTYRK